MPKTPKLSKRTFEFLAAWAKEALGPVACHSLATALARTNPNFKRERFLLACGLSKDEI